jgi:hypothetical protein
LERQLQSAAPMLTRVAISAIVASLLFACASATSAPRPLESGYLVIKPDVSVSRNAQPAIAKNAAVDERSDVMAEILAIPPGQ